MRNGLIFVLILGWLGFAEAMAAPSAASEETQLPLPLTLEKVLALADRQSVEKLALLQRQAALKAEMLDAQRVKAFSVALRGVVGAHQFSSDHHRYHALQLNVTKVLWDSGRTDALMQSLKGQAKALKLLEQDAVNAYRLRLIEAFFNILLADAAYRALNEEMAVRYVELDRARDRHALGSVSDVTLAKLEKEYQALLVQRTDAELLQRQRRVELAILLNRPQALIDEVAPPKLKVQMKIPDLTVLLKQVQARNPQLQALKLQKQALLQKMSWAQKQKAPVLALQAQAGPRYYEREPDKDAWNVNLALTWPLYDGGNAAARQAAVKAALVQLNQKEKQTRQQLLRQAVESWRVLSANSAKRKYLQAYADFVDLNMEYKRGVYESEESTDIGDAMIEQSQYEQAVLKTAFDYMLNVYRLKRLLGEQVP